MRGRAPEKVAELIAARLQFVTGSAHLIATMSPVPPHRDADTASVLTAATNEWVASREDPRDTTSEGGDLFDAFEAWIKALPWKPWFFPAMCAVLAAIVALSWKECDAPQKARVERQNCHDHIKITVLHDKDFLKLRTQGKIRLSLFSDVDQTRKVEEIRGDTPGPSGAVVLTNAGIRIVDVVEPTDNRDIVLALKYQDSLGNWHTLDVDGPAVYKLPHILKGDLIEVGWTSGGCAQEHVDYIEQPGGKTR